MSKNSEKNALVLIVDDNPLNIKFLQTLFTSQSYRVYSAEDGLQACRLSKKIIPDIILLDIMMPVMNGFDACKRLKAMPETKNIPIIFLTSKADTKDILKGFKLGAVDYITKPFQYKILLARVSTHLKLKFARDILKKMAILDGLTQLYNHGYINKRLAQEISAAKRHSHPLSVFMFDLDHLKNINDTYGHSVGNNVFVKISATLKENMREEDIIGRYGGDEFLIILPNTRRQAGYKVAEHVRNMICQLEWCHDKMKVTISGGITAMQKEKNADELIAKTDALLYQAKHNGRNSIVFG
jgi:diguanylate cyclase (GGDEF)-like protein